MNAARFVDTINFNRTGTSDGTSKNAISVSNIEFNLFPLSGAWGEYFGSRGQLTFGPDGSVDIEHANVRVSYGGENSHFNARVGVMEPWEGYGAADLHTATISAPLLWSTPASDGTTGSNTFFTPLNQAGLEAGYTIGGFNATLSVFNGSYINGSGELHASLGGSSVRPSSDPAFNRKDFQLIANQFIGKESAISAIYYHGNLTIPLTNAPIPNWPNWIDTFDRVSGYATVSLVKPLTLYAGLGAGWDNKFDPNLNAISDSKFRSTGWFAEAYLHYNEYLGNSFRFDYFDPSNDTDNDAQTAVTAALNGTLLNGAQAVFEYQWAHAQGFPNTNTHTAQLELIYAF